MIFPDRETAGKLLGGYIKENLKDTKDILVVGIPRGGVVVAKEVAKVLGADMSILLVRKLGVPENPELAFGAIDPDGNIYLDEETVKYFRLSEEDIKRIAKKELEKIRERERLFLKNRTPNFSGKTVILVDDGIATGMTVTAGAEYLRRKGAEKVIVASPVCPRDILPKLMKHADVVLCYHVSHQHPFAVGMFYRDFRQVEDDEVIRVLS